MDSCVHCGASLVPTPWNNSDRVSWYNLAGPPVGYHCERSPDHQHHPIPVTVAEAMDGLRAISDQLTKGPAGVEP